MKSIRVLLVDDHEIVRLGLMTLLNNQPDIDVIGEAGTAAEGLRLVDSLRPDVVLMDIRMPGEGAIEITAQIHSQFPESAVVVLTSFADDDLLIRAIQAGAAGYILKQVGNAELLRAIRASARKQAVTDPATTEKLFEHIRKTERNADEIAFQDLSDQEVRVLTLLARGKSNAQIGHNLRLSGNTVRNYLSTIMQKLHASNRTELAIYAVTHHLFEINSGQEEDFTETEDG